MILQALARYYDILAGDPQSGIAPSGYSPANVSYALSLSPEGELVAVLPLFEMAPRGKNLVEVPRRLVVPEQVKRASNIAPNFLCDNSAYILGISDKKSRDLQYAARRFAAFRQLNRDLLAQADCPEARAVLAFLDAYDPQAGREHPLIAGQLEGILKGGNLVFQLSGSRGFVHEALAIRSVWERHKARGGSDEVAQCLVTGEVGPVARLHASLKGVKDANSTGATLVGFNARAYESYNRTGGQGWNSPVSERAAFAYTTVLNYLLSSANPNRKFYLGDSTVVYWADSPDNAYAAAFAGLFEPEAGEPVETEDEARPAGRDQRAGQRLGQAAEKVRRAEAFDARRILEGLDPNTRFYILCLAPNAARISVRFFHTDPFEKIVQKIAAHYDDLGIIKEFENQPTRISIRRILEETVSKKSSDPKASPLLVGSLFRAILENGPYPAALYTAMLNRVHVDMDDDKKKIRKINYVRAAVIKACLTRKYRNQSQPQIQEVLCMSLNEQSTIPAYVLGRLFAVLEKAQQEAIGKMDASIKDRYFTSACATPASVFPVLLRLSQHHTAKAEYGQSLDRRIQDLLDLLEVDKTPYPAHLTLDEQGIFILGYYHQRAAFYQPRAAQPTN